MHYIANNFCLLSGCSILNEFKRRRWAMLQPAHLNYANTQILLVGRHSHRGSSLSDGVEAQIQHDWRHSEHIDTLRGVLSSLT